MKDETTGSGSFPIVGIGFSENGFGTLSELLDNLAKTTGMAFILAPGAGVDLTALQALKAVKKLKCTLLASGATLKPDHFYILPGNELLMPEGSKIVPGPSGGEAADYPINALFTALAETNGENAIGVLVPGESSDGLEGLNVIREANGLTLLTRHEQEGSFYEEPESELADIILPPKNSAEELSKLGAYIHALKNPEARNTEAEETTGMQDIFRLLKKASGVDFNQYKPASINRRVKRRMLLLKISSTEKYSSYLKEHPSEVQLLYQDILINVTRFFRDPDTFLYLKEELFPFLLKNRVAHEPLRIWVPACSTGQEAFSIAMILGMILDTDHLKNEVNIFATDLNDRSINKARLGVYTRNEVAGIDEAMLERFFEKTEDSYRVKKSIRDCCIFAPHNLLKDPPFSRIDFISCCNLFIYFDTDRQKQAVNTFHYSLNNGGFLLLGKSETIGSPGRFFRQTETGYKVNIYRRDISVRQALHSYGQADKDQKVVYLPKNQIAQPKIVADLQQNVKDLLLSKYVTPCVVINQNFEILQFHGSTDLFIDPAPGHATFNLLKMARANLRIDIRNAVHKSIKNNIVVKKKGMVISVRDMHFNMDLEVVPMEMVNGLKNFLVLFRDYPRQTFTEDEITDEKFQQELMTIKEDMNSVIDELETANDVLQILNEEIVSSNEELQTLNEELQTSREEMEASNDELSSVNDQLRLVNDQFRETLDYTDGIIASISEAIIVLNKNLIVKSANNAFYNIFDCNQKTTEGQHLFTICEGQFDLPVLRQAIDTIQEQKQFRDLEIEHHFNGSGKRILLFSGTLFIQKAQNEELYFITIRDISDLIEAAKLVKQAEWFHDIANTAPVMIWAAEGEKNFTFFNDTWKAFTGLTYEQEKETGWLERIHPEDRKSFVEVYTQAFASGSAFSAQYRFLRYDGQYRWLLNNGVPTFIGNRLSGYIGTCTDIHTQKMFSEELESKVSERTLELVAANDSFKRINTELQQYAYIASHDLQEPLRKLQTFADILQQKYEADLPKGAVEYIGKMTACSERMTQLIQDLLNFSSATGATETFEPTDLNAVLQDVLEDFNLEQLPIVIEAGQLPVIDAVPQHLKQLFRNLVSNAVKFRKKNKELKLEVFAEEVSPEAIKRYDLSKQLSYSELVFKDNGIGFDPAFAEQIFVIFKRLNNTNRTKGTGIGLALCHKITLNHKGAIFARSNGKDGASFHVILPHQQLEKQEAD